MKIIAELTLVAFLEDGGAIGLKFKTNYTPTITPEHKNACKWTFDLVNNCFQKNILEKQQAEAQNELLKGATKQ